MKASLPSRSLRSPLPSPARIRAGARPVRPPSARGHRHDRHERRGRHRVAPRLLARPSVHPALLDPVEGQGQGARRLQGEVHDDQGRLRRRGAPRLVPERRRPLLRPRQDRVLRRHALLPRGRRLHGPVRDQRRSRGDREVAERQRPGRSGQAVEQARLRHVRPDEHARTAAPRRSSSTTGQRAPRRDALRAVRAGRPGDGRRRLALQGLRRGSPEGHGPRPGSHPGRRATRTSTRRFPSSTRSSTPRSSSNATALPSGSSSRRLGRAGSEARP